jgi:hypothetical protein
MMGTKLAVVMARASGCSEVMWNWLLLPPEIRRDTVSINDDFSGIYQANFSLGLS